MSWRAVAFAALVALAAAGCRERPAAVTVSVPAQTAMAAGPVAPPPENLEPPASSAPMLLPGSGALVKAPRSIAASLAAGAGEAGDIRINFVNADIRDVAHSVLGDLLHLNYTIDAKLQATVTVQTSRPLTRDQVLPVFAEVLRADGLALGENGGVYRIVALDDAAHSGAPTVMLGSGGGEAPAANATVVVHILPLRYVSATEVERVLDPLLPKGVSIEPDPVRNVLILTGAGEDVRWVDDMVSSFDLDLLSGMSFGIFPLETGTPRTVVSELDTIFGAGGSVPLPGVLHFAPLDAMNAILVVSPQRRYIDEAGGWIERFDKGEGDSGPRVFEYYVQNSRAADLAKVLSQLFTSGEVQTVQAPGSAAKSAIQAGASSTSMTSGLPALGASSAAAPGQGAAPGLPQIGAAAPQAAPETNAASPAGPDAETPNLTQALQAALGGTAAPSGPQLPKVRIVADEKNNALLVYARPSDYRMLEDAIRKLDVVPLQVLIEATIAEVTLNNDLQYGLQYFFTHGNSNEEFSSGAAGTGSAADIAPAIPGFNYIYGTASSKVVLSALAQLTHVNVVSAPQLLVLDHQTAALQVGDEVPVISQTAQSVVTSDSPIVNSVQYINTGVILQVTPRVNSSGLVTLDIDQAVSDVSATTTSNIDSPTITQRRIVTSAAVQDGETIALGGLILDNQTDARSGIPVLSSIPVIGALFGTTTRNRDRTELLVLLTPKIIRNASEARTMSEELRHRLESIGPLDLPHD